MIRRILTGLRAEAAFIVLLAVASVGAWLYVQNRKLTADLGDAVQRAEVICARAGSDWSATRDAKRGVVCARHVAGLAKFERDAAQQTARILTEEMRAANDRTLKDNQAARLAAEAARAAAIRMEAADAQAERRNIVDREWTSAVNGLAGLRAPSR